jgi:hypothetical protein
MKIKLRGRGSSTTVKSPNRDKKAPARCEIKPKKNEVIRLHTDDGSGFLDIVCRGKSFYILSSSDLIDPDSYLGYNWLKR